MHLKPFRQLKGTTDAEKCASMFADLPDIGVIYAQEKKNGVFCEVTLEPYAKEYVWCTTRRGKQWPGAFFPAEITQPLQRFLRGSSTIAGVYAEIVWPNHSLPETAGAVSVNRTMIDPIAAAEIQFCIFDVIMTSPRLESSHYSHRRVAMEYADRCFPNHFAPLERIIVVPTFPLQSPADAEQFYQNQIEKGAEGVVYRVPPDYPLPNGTVSPWRIKRTQLYTEEGVCVEAVRGKGKRAHLLGALILRRTDGSVVRVGGGTGMTDAVLQSLWKRPPLGKQVTFTYADEAEDGTPLRPQFIAVRDYEY